LQWDLPITKKVVFGGNYTFGSFKHNQTGVGSSENYISGLSTASGVRLQTPWYYDEIFSRDAVVNGNVVWSPNGRETWSPMQKQDSEFQLRYYLIVNLTQGRAKSNFSLRGSYTGDTLEYEWMNVLVGKPVIPGVINYPLDSNTIINAQFSDQIRAYFNQYNRGQSFGNSLTYNLAMPLARNVSWFVNVDVANVFNHISRGNTVPGSTSTGSGGSFSTTGVIPWPIPYSATGNQPSNWATIAWNPFRDGWTWPGGNVSDRFTERNKATRSISMQTGIRF
jgi:hypothetical protein